MADSSSKFVHASAVLLNGNSRYYIFKDSNVIGRSPESLICLEDQIISRKHCVIGKCEDCSFTIHDSSTTGTYLNKRKMLKGKVYKLQDHDQINLANVNKYTYTFISNKRLKTNTEKSEELSLRIKEKMVNFDNTYTDNMKNLDSKLTQIETEKSDLKENMNRRIEEQENAFKNERLSLSSLLHATKEQKEEAEKKLREIEVNAGLEKRKLMEEVERKMADISKKEKELQQAKNEMELRYQNERRELEDRCQAEICELKEKLAEFELEQKRLQGETREAEQKLEETKKTLLDCEKEQNRLSEEKKEVESKLESKIVNLAKESSSKDEVVKHLEKQLREQEKAAEKFKKEMEVLEEELQCSICAELFIEPTVLNCGHMFCKTCINEWKKKKKVCPMCRAVIVTSVRIFAVDTIIESNVALLSDEAKSRREAVIIQRQKPVENSKGRKRKHTSNVRMPAGPSRPSTARMNIGRLEGNMFMSDNTSNLDISSRQRRVPLPRTEPVFMTIESPPRDVGQSQQLELINVEPPDEFSWYTVGPSHRTRSRSMAQTDRGPEPWEVPAYVSVAAVDLTHLPSNITATTSTREPIDLTNPQLYTPPARHVTTTIDLTTP